MQELLYHVQNLLFRIARGYFVRLNLALQQLELDKLLRGSDHFFRAVLLLLHGVCDAWNLLLKSLLLRLNR